MKDLKLKISKLDSLSDLNELSEFINDVKTMLSKTTMKVGDKVFVVQKTKRTPGIISKMNLKRALVEMRGRMYNVPFGMLELA